MATLSELITTLKGKMLPLAGGTLTGALTAPSVSITNDNAKVNGKNIVRSVNGTSAGTDGNVAITIPSAYVHPNSGVTAGTYNNVTVNAQGHVTAGTNVTEGVPTGTILPYCGTSAPSGFLICNGGAISRTSYSALFQMIGTKYGSGNGSTTFNLPDMHHRFLEGTTTTSEVNTYVSAGLPNISGNTSQVIFRKESSESTTTKTGVFYNTSRMGDYWDSNNGKSYQGDRYRLVFNASYSDSIYGNSSTVHPLSIRILYVIKY